VCAQLQDPPRDLPLDHPRVQDAIYHWTQQLVNLYEHNPVAFGVGPRITQLQPDVGLTIAQNAWPKLANAKTRTGLLKAFAFSKNLPDQHPHTLKVLHLGLIDADPAVRNYAATYLAPFALEDFTDRPDAYLAWHETHGQMSLEQLTAATRPKLKTIITEIEQALAAGDLDQASDIVQTLRGHRDPYAIPFLIAVIEAENSPSAIGSVDNEQTRDGPAWRQWWEDNKSNYPADIQQLPIPDYRALLATGLQKREKAEAEAKRDPFKAEDRLINDNPNMRYFLLGPKDKATAPADGYKLVVVLPGGDGSARFHPFVKNLYQQAFDDDYLIAQPVAFKWYRYQAITWPTRINPEMRQGFGTEDFIEAVIRDVKKHHPVNPKHVFTLAWSSGGPAAYNIALQQQTSVRGSYIAASVYRPRWHPPVANAKGRPFVIDHSPQDTICPFHLAQRAEDEILRAGGAVNFTTYQGGHGWRGDAFGRVRDGMAWLVEQTK
jgi:predicted esterase